MKRVFAIALVLLFGLGPLGWALSTDDDARLPMCCRRHGVHHCTGMGAMQPDPSGAAAFTAHGTCPAYPGAAVAPVVGAALAPESSETSPLTASARVVAHASGDVDSSSLRTHAGRGPPVRA
jgi:hypothetical protein